MAAACIHTGNEVGVKRWLGRLPTRKREAVLEVLRRAQERTKGGGQASSVNFLRVLAEAGSTRGVRLQRDVMRRTESLRQFATKVAVRAKIDPVDFESGIGAKLPTLRRIYLQATDPSVTPPPPDDGPGSSVN